MSLAHNEHDPSAKSTTNDCTAECAHRSFCQYDRKCYLKTCRAVPNNCSPCTDDCTHHRAHHPGQHNLLRLVTMFASAVELIHAYLPRFTDSAPRQTEKQQNRG